MMLGGTAYRLKPSAPLTAVTGSSWSRGEYPTLSATRYGSSQNEGKVPHKRATKGTPSLDTWARNWPTTTAGNKANEGTSLTDATARDGRHDPTMCKHGGPCRPKLSPRFAESLMGFPVGWTDLGPLETRSFRKSRKSSASTSRKRG